MVNEIDCFQFDDTLSDNLIGNLAKKVKTTTEEEKTVCWLTLHNLTVNDTGKI